VTIKSRIRTIPHYPKQGIMFRDITTLLKDPVGLRLTVDEIANRYKAQKISKVAGIESRGFIIGAPAALALGTGIAIVRKPGKLPYRTHQASYQLEYGSDTLEIHHDAIGAGHRVLLIDDLLATGGTASAAIQLVEQCGGRVAACAFVIELGFLDGRARLAPHEVHSLIRY
jgi:adenine phosphoribosyltransferase